MHICLLTNRAVDEVPAARVTVRALRAAGNTISEVRLVSPSADPPEDGIVAVPTRVPRGGGKPGSLLRRLQPEGWRTRNMESRMATAAAATGARLFLPVPTNLLTAASLAARRVGGAVMRTPAQPDAGDVDLVRLAPHHPELAQPIASAVLEDKRKDGQPYPPALLFHTPADPRSGYRPEAGRWAGKKIVLVYRKTDTNPGKYLEAALHRSGAEVRVETQGLDFDTVDPDTFFVLFVEGPYPALQVRGTTPRVPVLFWFHHGEHHLHTNLRLADRYRADAVLMAHSWHLAHWVPAPVHRFPFGIPTELLDPSRPLAERRYDVAMVGAKLWGGGPYGSRQALVAALEEGFPRERLGFGENVTADEMAALYNEARIIPNEGGTRHYPITMRVFEAIGAGAVLLTEDLPGTDVLFERHRHYVVLEDDIASQARRLLSDLHGLQSIATAALAHARAHHTYDHRVDELFEIAAGTTKRTIPETRSRSRLAELIDGDAEVQRVAHFGAPQLEDELESRQVFDSASLAPEQLAPAKMESVAIRADDVSGFTELLRAARRYLYLEGAAEGLEEYLAAEHPEAVVDRTGDLVRVDLLAESYRVLPHEVVVEGLGP